METFPNPEQNSDTSANLLYRNRPEYVLQKIDDNYAQLLQEGKEGKVGYIFTGSKDYNLTDNDIKASYVVHAQKSRKAMQGDNSPIKILDVGAADGQFLDKAREENPNAVLYGISAHDMRVGSIKDPEKRINYVLTTNAETISDTIDEKFDVIISAKTFRHFIDPLGTLQEMYSRLEDDGVMLIDELKTSGLEEDIFSLISYLKSLGYQIEADYQYQVTQDGLKASGFESIAIRKSKDLQELVLPVAYDGFDAENSVKYKIDPNVPHVGIDIPEPLKKFIDGEEKLHGRRTWRNGVYNGILSNRLNMDYNPDVSALEKWESEISGVHKFDEIHTLEHDAVQALRSMDEELRDYNFKNERYAGIIEGKQPTT